MGAPCISIVNYGMGNIGSVANAFRQLGAAPEIAATPEALTRADILVLPGVGSFAQAMRNLVARGLAAPLAERLERDGVPFLGICLGMQLLTRDSTEGGFAAGLGLIDGSVRKFRSCGQRIPHVGWNELEQAHPDPLFHGIEPGAHFYFDHSYVVSCPAECCLAACHHGERFVAALRRENIMAVQFHPEKSQRFGLKLLRNFINISLSMTGRGA